MTRPKKQLLINDLTNLCVKHHVSFATLFKIIGDLKDRKIDLKKEKDVDEVGAREFWGGNLIKQVKKVMKKRLF